MQEETNYCCIKGEGFNFSIVPFSVSCDEKLSIASRGVFTVLTRFMNLEDKKCFPSLNTLAKICALSKNSLLKYLNELERAGAIKKEKRTASDGTLMSNLYTLNGYYKRGVVQNLNYGSSKYELGMVQNLNGGSSNFEPELKPYNYNHINYNNTPVAAAAAVCDIPIPDLPLVEAPPPKKKKEKMPKGYTAEFEEFWQAYPRRIDKASAFKAWQRKLNSGAPAQNLITAAKNYALKVRGTEERYIKYPGTFLNAIDPGEYQEAPPTTQEQRLAHNADGSIGTINQAAQDAEMQRLLEHYKGTKYWAEMKADEEARKQNEHQRSVSDNPGTTGRDRPTEGETVPRSLWGVEVPF